MGDVGTLVMDRPLPSEKSIADYFRHEVPDIVVRAILKLFISLNSHAKPINIVYAEDPRIRGFLYDIDNYPTEKSVVRAIAEQRRLYNKGPKQREFQIDCGQAIVSARSYLAYAAGIYVGFIFQPNPSYKEKRLPNDLSHERIAAAMLQTMQEFNLASKLINLGTFPIMQKRYFEILVTSPE